MAPGSVRPVGAGRMHLFGGGARASALRALSRGNRQAYAWGRGYVRRWNLMGRVRCHRYGVQAWAVIPVKGGDRVGEDYDPQRRHIRPNNLGRSSTKVVDNPVDKSQRRYRSLNSS